MKGVIKNQQSRSGADIKRLMFPSSLAVIDTKHFIQDRTNLFHDSLSPVTSDLSNMVANHQDLNASPSDPQAVERGVEKKPWPTIGVQELEPVVADLVKKALSNPATWPGGLPTTPVYAFGPSTPPLDTDEQL
jgi:hypothetical protein